MPKMIVSTNPANPDEVVLETASRSDEEIDSAVRAGHEAFLSWSRGSAANRAVGLTAVADLIDASRAELAEMIRREVGKPVAEAEGEVARAEALVRFHAQTALDPDGETFPPFPGTDLLMAKRVPHGVCGLITPWNFPLAIPLWKAAPALAAGNAVIIKPASPAIGCAKKLGEIFAEALPEGVAQIAPGGRETAGALIDHELVRCISFTGSTTVGRSIIARATERGIPVQAEMGGQNPSVVLADADLEFTATTVAGAAMGYAGQKCTATSRVVIDRAVMDDFLGHLESETAKMTMGPMSDAAAMVGPLVTADACQRVAEATSGYRDDIIFGGTLPTGDEWQHGNWCAPVAYRSNNSSPLARVELFAPVLTVLEANDLSEAIEIANDTPFGLSASLFTADLGAALDYVRRIEVGLVRVNGDTTGVDPHAPFGGMKGSSSGSREQGRAARDFYTEVRTIQIHP